MKPLTNVSSNIAKAMIAIIAVSIFCFVSSQLMSVMWGEVGGSAPELMSAV